jgi:hypothetical protein
VTSVLHRDEEHDLPARAVEETPYLRWVPTLRYTQFWVGGVQVDPATVRPLAPTRPRQPARCFSLARDWTAAAELVYNYCTRVKVTRGRWFVPEHGRSLEMSEPLRFERLSRIRHKAGGPDMFVRRQPSVSTVVCAWWSADKHYHEVEFDVDEVMAVDRRLNVGV